MTDLLDRWGEAINSIREKTPYPLTVVMARYGGVYEGGVFLAFNYHPEALPTGWDGDDVTCHAFWLDFDKPVGRGQSPNQAVLDLAAQLS